MISANKTMVLMAVLIAVLFALPGAARAEDPNPFNPDCRDGIIGGGYVTSQVSGGKALFAIAAGYLTPNSPLGGFFSMTDTKAGLKIKSLSVDDYSGSHCGGFDPEGGPCYDRYVAGMAQVTLNGVKTTRSFSMETIITPSMSAPDYLVWIPAGCPDLNNCPLHLQVVTKGIMYIWRPDTTTPGCF